MFVKCRYVLNLNKLSLQYKERYLAIYGDKMLAPKQRRTGRSATRKVGTLIRELSDDEDEIDEDTLNLAPNELHAPWLKDFHGYLNSKDQLGSMSVIEWWGVSISCYFSNQRHPTSLIMPQWNANRYDVWASLARDMLPIMASSVSSERAFSSAGITISKRRNRLKPDIVEALQFLKCSYHRNLLFREEASAQHEVDELEYEDEDIEEVVDEKGDAADKGVVDVEVVEDDDVDVVDISE
jgi:hAT family C-terminal dimerisation region